MWITAAARTFVMGRQQPSRTRLFGNSDFWDFVSHIGNATNRVKGLMVALTKFVASAPVKQTSRGISIVAHAQQVGEPMGCA